MFESGNRVQDTLADLAEIMGGARRRDLPRTDETARGYQARAALRSWRKPPTRWKRAANSCW